MNILHFYFSSPLIFIILGANRYLFSNTLSLHSSFNIRDRTSEPYCTTGYVMVLYILITVYCTK